MKYRSPISDLYLSMLLLPYGLGGVVDQYMGATYEYGRIAVFASMSTICCFGLYAHFFASIRTRMVSTFGVMSIMVAQSVIYSRASFAAAAYCVAFVGVSVHAMLIMWRGIPSEKIQIRWVGHFDLVLSVVWVVNSVWVALLHLGDASKIPDPAPGLGSTGIQYWGIAALVFPLLNLVGVSRDSKAIRTTGAAGAGVISGVMAIVYAVYDPSMAAGPAVFSAFYVISFFEALRRA